MKIYVLYFLFIGSANAADCGKVLSEPKPIWEQVVENGRSAAIRVAIADRAALSGNAKLLMLSWIKRFIQLHIFKELNLKNDQVYILPIKARFKRKVDIYFSAEITRTVDDSKLISYTLENFKTVDTDQFLELLKELSLKPQSNWLKTKWNIQIPGGLPVYRGTTLPGLVFQLGMLFKDFEKLIQLEEMPADSEITLVRPELDKPDRGVFFAQRFVFYKTQQGEIQLLAYEP